jgi:hypothetical protein
LKLKKKKKINNKKSKIKGTELKYKVKNVIKKNLFVVDDTEFILIILL